MKTLTSLLLIAGQIILAVLLIPTTLIFSNLMTAMLILAPLALVNAAFLLYSGLSLRSSEPQARIIVPIVLVGILLIGVLFKIYDLTVWDNTYDESVVDQLKNISQIEHTHHRSPINCFINIIAGLIAYCYQPKKPSLILSLAPLLSA